MSNEPYVDQESVLVSMKSPMMDRATTAMLPANLSVQQALDTIRTGPAKDSDARRVVEQLVRETAGVFYFLGMNAAGEVSRIEPSARLRDIAAPRQMRTAAGSVEKLLVAPLEVQSYCKVGVSES